MLHLLQEAASKTVELPPPPASFPEWAVWLCGVGAALIAAFTVYKVKFGKKAPDA